MHICVQNTHINLSIAEYRVHCLYGSKLKTAKFLIDFWENKEIRRQCVVCNFWKLVTWETKNWQQFLEKIVFKNIFKVKIIMFKWTNFTPKIKIFFLHFCLDRHLFYLTCQERNPAGYEKGQFETYFFFSKDFQQWFPSCFCGR